MGCSNSKQSKYCQCQGPYSIKSQKSYSMNVHHPPEKKGDSYHVVSLTSSTLGSIRLGPPKNSKLDVCHEEENYQNPKYYKMGMVEAKAWSKMIDEKIPKVFPKTPIRARVSTPEMVDVKELMEGLEDISPLRVREHIRSFSFHVSTDSIQPFVDSPKSDVGCHEYTLVSPKKTIWFDSQEKGGTDLENCGLISKALLSEIDPEVIHVFRKALQELSPNNPFYFIPRDGFHDHEQKMDGIMAIEVTEEKTENCSKVDEDKKVVEEENGHMYCAKKRVVLYFTSLRGVRKTYEDCCYVRLTLKEFGVRVDERDVSMHSGFKEELKEVLGEGVKDGLPRVFVGENYIGGVEEIRRLHEDGKLEQVFQGCEMADDESGNLIQVCEACGDLRFVVCETCSGSCKIYYEWEANGEEYEENDYGFHKCPDCNENGIIRCPFCCY